MAGEPGERTAIRGQVWESPAAEAKRRGSYTTPPGSTPGGWAGNNNTRGGEGMATNAELRAAAEQIMSDMQESYPREEIDLNAAEKLARHILATVPADDDEPVTGSIAEAFAALREVSGGRWDNVDPEEFVRQLRDDCCECKPDDDDEPVTREKVLAIAGARILGPSRYAIQPESPCYILVDMSEQAGGVPVELAVCDPHTGSHVTVAWGPTMKIVRGLVESLSTKPKGGA